MKEKMPWLKIRLRELGRTPTALAKALGIAPPRVYEMISGRRHIQPNEIEPMAKFLNWTLAELTERLPARSQPTVEHAPGSGMTHSAVVRRMVIDAPKLVDADEVKAAVLSCIAERFAGRPIGWGTIEHGLALAAFEMKMQSLSQSTG